MILFLVTGVTGGRWFDRLDTPFRCITWNALNQLTAVAKNAVTSASYSYDPLGRRVENIVDTATTLWVYDGEEIVRQNAGATTTFVHGPGIDEPLGQTTGATTEYLHADALGSIVRHTSSAGAIAQTIAYDAWGKIDSGAPAPYGFTGREWDPTVGLYYYRARYYDASRGTFLSEDPLQNADPHQYLYVLGNPTRFRDPSGLVADDGVCHAWPTPTPIIELPSDPCREWPGCMSAPKPTPKVDPTPTCAAPGAGGCRLQCRLDRKRFNDCMLGLGQSSNDPLPDIVDSTNGYPPRKQKKAVDLKARSQGHRRATTGAMGPQGASVPLEIMASCSRKALVCDVVPK